MPSPSTRDRRGRGMRGPAVLGRDVPLVDRRERFDRIALDVVSAIERRWADRLGLLEYGVEDVPDLPPDWHGDAVPLATTVPGRSGTPTRIVLFRRPIEHRAETLADLHAAVLTVVVDQVADLLGLPAEDVDPRYGDDV